MRQKEKGFTLIEIVIVVSIIVVLLCIMIIGITEIRWRVGVAQCVSNLGQIGLALRMYAQDWNGFAPPYYTDTDEFEQSVRLVAAFMPYTKNEDIWVCPRDLWNGIEWKRRKYRGRYGLTSYQVAFRYGFTPIRVDAPPILTPVEIEYFKRYIGNWEIRRKCAICMGIYKDYLRWIYATDGGLLSLNHQRFRGDRIFMLHLLLSGQVKVWWRPNTINIHSNYPCPTPKLPNDWPFSDFHY